MAAFGIASRTPLDSWCRLYREGGAEALGPKPKGPAGESAPKTHEQELEARVRRLEAESAYLKKSAPWRRRSLELGEVPGDRDAFRARPRPLRPIGGRRAPEVDLPPRPLAPAEADEAGAVGEGGRGVLPHGQRLYSSIKKSTFRSAGFRHFAGKRRRTSHPSLPISRASAPRPSSCSGR